MDVIIYAMNVEKRKRTYQTN